MGRPTLEQESWEEMGAALSKLAELSHLETLCSLPMERRRIRRDFDKVLLLALEIVYARHMDAYRHRPRKLRAAQLRLVA